MCHEIGKCRNRRDIYAQALFDLLHSGKVPAAAFLAVHRDDNTADLRTGIANNTDRFANGRARCYYIVDDQHAALQRAADYAAALAMLFGFFAVECVREIDIVLVGHRRGAQSSQRNAFVGGPEDHVGVFVPGMDDRSIKTAQSCRRGAAGEFTGVKKIRALAA